MSDRWKDYSLPPSAGMASGQLEWWVYLTSSLSISIRRRPGEPWTLMVSCDTTGMNYRTRLESTDLGTVQREALGKTRKYLLSLVDEVCE